MRTKIINKHTIILFIASLCINGIFLYVNRTSLFCSGLMKHHGEIAYNLYQHNSIKINPERAGYLGSQEASLGRRVDYHEIDHKSFGPPTQFRNHFDSIGYGVFIGLLWKITNSLSYFDIQLFQIIFFSLLLFLFYQIILMLLGVQVALFSSIALLLFFPIAFLNVQVLRDVWPFYSAVILAYVVLKYLLKKSSWTALATGGAIVALFQFMKPHAFMMIFTMTTFLIANVIFTKFFYPRQAIGLWSRTVKCIGIILATNVLFFWVPFATYNKIAYDRYIASATGINLLEGLGEVKNPWGYKLSDAWYAEFMKKNYPNLSPLEQDDKAKELFFQAVKERPWFYIKLLIKRVPRMILPGLPWFNYQSKDGLWTMYINGKPLSEVVRLIFKSPAILFDFVARHIYIGLFLLLAYIGMLIAFIRKKYFALFFIGYGIMKAAGSVMLLHTDHRYLIPYYAFFSVFVGYFFSIFCPSIGEEK